MSSLFVSSTQVTDLGPVATLTSLDTLRMRGLDIKDLSPLANAAPRLRTLRASSTVPAALRRARPQLDAQVR
jgi:Leucine-rich repeat (LRR) protein